MTTRTIHVSELAPLLAQAHVAREDREDVATAVALAANNSADPLKAVLLTLTDYHYGIFQRRPQFTGHSRLLTNWMAGVIVELQELELI